MGLSLEKEPSNRGVMLMNMMENRMTRTKAEEDRHRGLGLCLGAMEGASETSSVGQQI